MATASYTLITDTHGYPWGSIAADFDLGDNTNTDNSGYSEAIHYTNASKIKLYGNHDMQQDPGHKNQLACWADPNQPITFFGLDSSTNVNNLIIPIEEIIEMGRKMEALEANRNIAVLTHAPLFPHGGWMGESSGSPAVNNDILLGLLLAFKARNSDYGISYSDKSGINRTETFDFSGKTGDVVGCFCGHVHNNIRCYYRNIYFESFYTNGASEWLTSDKNNAGMYPPVSQSINIDFQKKTVNEQPYNITGKDLLTEIPTVLHTVDKRYGNAATGANIMYPGSTSYPKFYQKRYVGYSQSASGGATSPNGISNSWWYVNGAYIHGLGFTAKYFRFDASGELRYYSTTGHAGTDFTEIPNYQSASIVFDTVPCPSTSPGKTWSFKNGLFEGVRSTPSFSYTSGTIQGKNGYAIKFNSSGLATGITLNGASATYPAGENWINVNSLSVYWRGFGDLATSDITTKTPQVGITGTFPSGGTKLDLARSTSSGYNWIPNRVNLLMRVVGNNNTVYWLYDGRLTNLTDSKVGI